MRIHIYEEEITDRVSIITKDVPQDDGTTEGNVVRFYGVRFWLESPAAILEHSTPEDNDENAVTFWVRANGIVKMQDLLHDAIGLLATI